jgi:adenylosuccinate synthase
MSLVVDILVGLSYGDEGKGCITDALLKSGEYTHCIKSNGGHNSGHSIVYNGRRVVTHAVPSGVLQGVKSIIGPGCVLNFNLLKKEIQELQDSGIDVHSYLHVDHRVHVLEQEHILEEMNETNVGTTRKGNGPCYRDKYVRKNLRVEDYGDEIQKLGIGLIDTYQEFFSGSPVTALFEGGQGFHLDIDWGEYPYVTSSHCTAAGAMLNGVPHQSVRKVIGIAKVYDTYVGAKKFEPDDPTLDIIRKVGKEYGSTTGRPRQCNYLNLDKLVKAIRVNGATDIYINKVDILEWVGVWKAYIGGRLVSFENKNEFIGVITDHLLTACPSIDNITFSGTAEGI